MAKEIWNYIYPNDNDTLYNIKTSDLLELLKQIYTYQPQYRETLQFPRSATFGMELEFETENPQELKHHIHSKIGSKWIFKTEISMSQGYEVTSGICTDKKEIWQELKRLCEYLKENTRCTKDCGAHVHVGAHLLGKDTKGILNLMLLWSVYENIIFKFSYNKDKGPRPDIMKYARKMNAEFMATYLKYYDKNFAIEDVIRSYKERKLNAVNLKNMSYFNSRKARNTVEFRCPNGTLDEITWQNNVNFFVKFMILCKKGHFDKDKVLRRDSINKDKIFTYHDYNKLYIDEALELVDLVFDNNLDKINFLKQYLKLYDLFSYDEACQKVFERGRILRK